MKINTGSTVSLTTFRLRKEYKQELNETKIQESRLSDGCGEFGC